PSVAAADRRPASWARAPRVLGMPERWTVELQRAGTVVRTVTGAPIPADLAIGPDPGVTPTPTPDGLAVDDGMLWVVDFERAVEVGMAVRIPLEPADVE